MILGPTGRNLGAGMSGGVAYVLDAEGQLARRCNLELVAIEERLSAEEEDWLRDVIERHLLVAGSARARDVIEDWSSVRPLFRRVAPRPFAGALSRPALIPLAPLEDRVESTGLSVS